MTIGSGRIIFQSLARINKSINDGEFFKIHEFNESIENCKKNNSTLHLIGLLQEEGVHSHKKHLYAIMELCKQKDFKNFCIHVITDGRDAPVTNSLKHLMELIEKTHEYGGKVVSVNGRYYAMDRDKKWDRIKKAYDCIVKGIGEVFKDPIEYVKNSHKQEVFDEFIIPGKLEGYHGMKEKDSVIFYNFRTDRARQLTQAIIENEFDGFERDPMDVYYVGMTQYYRPMNGNVAFKDISIKNILGEVVSKNNLKQLRISETEKYAHVTFFFNAQIEQAFENEERIMIESPKVATYDLKPEMSAYQLTEKLCEELKKAEHDLIVTNIVNGDMIGHTGIKEAIHKAIKVVDECVGKIIQANEEYVILLTSDHGNVEDQTDDWRTSHTINKVPFVLINKEAKLNEGGLRDIAPTILDLFNIEKPEEMTGKSLINND